MFRGDDAWFVAEPAQRVADKVRAQARLHADDAARQLLECVGKRQPFDLPTEAIFPSALKPTTWKTSLPMSMPIVVGTGAVLLRSMGCFSLSSRATVFAN
jgi:hypothetical protein